MNTYKITTKAFEKMDGLLFQSMLQLVQRQLNAVWQIEESANLVIVDVEQPEGQSFWETHPLQIQMIVYARQNIYNAQWYLPKPIRVQPLVQLLNGLATSRLEQSQTSNQTVTPVTRSALAPTRTPTTTVVTAEPSLPAELVFQPSDYLIGLLQTIPPSGHPQRLSYANQVPLYLLPQEQRCYTVPLSTMLGPTASDSIYTAPLKQIKQEILTPAALRTQVEKQALRAYPLETLYWLTALQASHGRLITNQSKQALVRLKQWPNFATLPHQPIHMNIAAFMLRKTADLTTIAAKTQATMTAVIDFFNACKVIGLIIEPGHVETIAEKELPETKRQVLKDILSRLTKK